MDQALQKLAASGEGSTKVVAVVTLLGSLCPITLAHVQAFDEARKLLLLLDPKSSARPTGLEHFDHILSFISANERRLLRFSQISGWSSSHQ